MQHTKALRTVWPPAPYTLDTIDACQLQEAIQMQVWPDTHFPTQYLSIHHSYPDCTTGKIVISKHELKHLYLASELAETRDRKQSTKHAKRALVWLLSTHNFKPFNTLHSQSPSSSLLEQ